MKPSKRKPLSYRLRRNLFGKYQPYLLGKVRGIVHVGANAGQERDEYARNAIAVAWVEPIDEVYQRLAANIAGYPRQKAYHYLVTNRDGATYTFNVASNEGASSSILPLGEHRDIFPDITFVRSVEMQGITLATLFAKEKIDPGQFDMLIVDTQGSELLVLEGALPLLAGFSFVQVEAADFEAYEGCCKVGDIQSFMTRQGFVECHRTGLAHHPDGGQYFELTFGRVPPSLWERLKV